jgi:hypothetical protein
VHDETAFEAEVAGMIRLTRVLHEGHGVTVLVEGRIAAEWAELLERECAQLAAEGRRVCLDLSGVIDIDSRSVRRLRALDPAAVTIARCTPLIEDLLHEHGDD